MTVQALDLLGQEEIPRLSRWGISSVEIERRAREFWKKNILNYKVYDL